MRTKAYAWPLAAASLLGAGLAAGCQAPRVTNPARPAGPISVDLSVGHFRPESTPVLRAMAVNLISERRAIEWFLGEYDRRTHLFEPAVRLSMADLSPGAIARFLAVTTAPRSAVPILLSHDLRPVNERTSQALPPEAAEYFQGLFTELSAARLNVLIIDDPQLRWGAPALPVIRR